MHYGSFFFARERGMRTLHAKVKGVDIGQRERLSTLDIQKGRMLYQCDNERGKQLIVLIFLSLNVRRMIFQFSFFSCTPPLSNQQQQLPLPHQSAAKLKPVHAPWLFVFSRAFKLYHRDIFLCSDRRL